VRDKENPLSDAIINAKEWFFTRVPLEFQPLVMFCVAGLLTWRAGKYLASDERGAFVKGLLVLPFAAVTFIYALFLWSWI
jgi:hypothetical protein